MKTRFPNSVAILMTVMACLSASAGADVLEAGKYYTWGIDGADLAIPEGAIITEAVLRIDNITNWNNNLHIHVIDNPLPNIVARTDSGPGDHFAGAGGLVTNRQYGLVDGDLVIVFSTVDTADSWVWDVFDSPFGFELADSSTVSYSSLLLELIDCAGNNTPFGLGFDPDGTDVGYDKVRLDITIATFEGPFQQEIRTFSIDGSDGGDDVTAYWKMEDNAANPTVVDYSGNYFHGQAQVNTSLRNVVGYDGNALHFDGSTDYIECGSSAELLADAWTVAGWVRCDQTPTPTLVSFGSTFPSIKLQNNGGGSPLVYMGKYNYRYFAAWAWAILSDGQWHHVAFTMPGSDADAINDAQMYLDGVKVNDTSTLDSGPQASKERFYIGVNHWSGTQFFGGDIDELRLYNRVLSESDIKNLYLLGH